MPKRRVPTNFTATRALTLAGTPVARGATVTAHNAAAALGRRLNAYVSRGWLIPDTSQYPETARRTILWSKKRNFPPTDYNPKEFLSL